MISYNPKRSVHYSTISRLLTCSCSSKCDLLSILPNRETIAQNRFGSVRTVRSQLGGRSKYHSCFRFLSENTWIRQYSTGTYPNCRRIAYKANKSRTYAPCWNDTDSVSCNIYLRKINIANVSNGSNHVGELIKHVHCPRIYALCEVVAQVVTIDCGHLVDPKRREHLVK